MKPKLKVLSPTAPPAFTDDISTALSLLREALGDEELRIRNEGARAMHAGALDTAASVIEFARQLDGFKDKVEELCAAWDSLEDARNDASPEVQKIVSKRLFGKRAKKGEITPQESYCRPILEALVELGGSADKNDVLAKVEAAMKKSFKPKDYGKLGRGEIRWRNKADWARNTMVNVDGRMKKKSKTGLWEISAQGRKWLEENA